MRMSVHLHANMQIVIVSSNVYFETISNRETPEIIDIPIDGYMPRYLSKSVAELIEKCIHSQKPREAKIVIEREGSVNYYRALSSPIVPGKTQDILNGVRLNFPRYSKIVEYYAA